jgi:hypothetical protein
MSTGIYGVTHHDQLFSQEACNTENDEYEEAIEKQVRSHNISLFLLCDL